jgi:hypothetical protein
LNPALHVMPGQGEEQVRHATTAEFTCDAVAIAE